MAIIYYKKKQNINIKKQKMERALIQSSFIIEHTSIFFVCLKMPHQTPLKRSDILKMLYYD